MRDQTPLFVDTGPWIALLDPRDQWHQAAASTMAGVGAVGRPLVTSNLVLMEVYTGLVGRVQRSAIARFRSSVRESSSVRVERVDEFTEEMAWELFMRYDDKAVGLVDCTSFAIMEQLGLATAFTFDRHFRQVGFQTLPRIE